MDRGFGYYFGNGVRTAAKVVLKGGRFLRYYLYFLAAFIGRLIPFFGAVFPVADMRRAKIARREGDAAVVRAFEGVDSGNKFGAAVLSVTLEALILLGGIAALGALGYGLYLLGFVLGAMALMTDPRLLAVIFAVPAMAGALIFAVAVLIMFAPVPYVVDANKKVSASGVMNAAVETMRRGGKFTCFLCVFVPLLIKGAYLGAVYGVLYCLAHIAMSPIALVLVCTLWVVIALALYIVFAPIFTFGSDIALQSLFEDISLDPSALENRTKGVFIKRAHGNSSEHSGLDSDLDRLFETTPEPKTEAADTRYVPPTDFEPKMSTYKEETAQEATAAEDVATEDVAAEKVVQTETAETVTAQADSEQELNEQVK